MTDAQVLGAILVLVPAALIFIVAMVRGYHVWLHIYKPHKKEDCEGHDHGQPGS